MATSAEYLPSFVLVDDDEDDRLLMRMALRETGNTFPIVEFENGAELIEYLQRELTEKGQSTLLWLIIMDVNMPIMMGSQALQIMRQHPIWRQVPVMMLSTSDDPDMIRSLKAMGANAFLTKPRTYAGLVEHIRTVFEPWMTKVQALEYH